MNNILSSTTGIQSYVVSHSNSTLLNNCNTSVLWHNRLGRANFTFVAPILKLYNIHSSNKHSNTFCTSCNLGKTHRLRAPLIDTAYHKPFDMIYTNLWGSSPNPSSSGYKYYIAFVDGHNRYTWLYFVKQKSEASQAFKNFHTFVQT